MASAYVDVADFVVGAAFKRTRYVCRRSELSSLQVVFVTDICSATIYAPQRHAGVEHVIGFFPVSAAACVSKTVDGVEQCYFEVLNPAKYTESAGEWFDAPTQMRYLFKPIASVKSYLLARRRLSLSASDSNSGNASKRERLPSGNSALRAGGRPISGLGGSSGRRQQDPVPGDRDLPACGSSPLTSGSLQPATVFAFCNSPSPDGASPRAICSEKRCSPLVFETTSNHAADDKAPNDQTAARSKLQLDADDEQQTARVPAALQSETAHGGAAHGGAEPANEASHRRVPTVPVATLLPVDASTQPVPADLKDLLNACCRQIAFQVATSTQSLTAGAQNAVVRFLADYYMKQLSIGPRGEVGHTSWFSHHGRFNDAAGVCINTDDGSVCMPFELAFLVRAEFPRSRFAADVSCGHPDCSTHGKAACLALKAGRATVCKFLSYVVVRANIMDVLRDKIRRAAQVASLVHGMKAVTITERSVVCSRYKGVAASGPVFVRDETPTAVEFHSAWPDRPLGMKPGTYETICKCYEKVLAEVQSHRGASTLLASAKQVIDRENARASQESMATGTVRLDVGVASRLFATSNIRGTERSFGGIFLNSKQPVDTNARIASHGAAVPGGAPGAARPSVVVPPCIQRLVTTSHMSNYARMMLARYMQVFDADTQQEIFSSLAALSQSPAEFALYSREIGVQSASILRDQSWTEVANAVKGCASKPALHSAPCLAFMSRKRPELNMCPYTGNLSSRVSACCAEMRISSDIPSGKSSGGKQPGAQCSPDIEDIVPERYWSPNRVTKRAHIPSVSL